MTDYEDEQELLKKGITDTPFPKDSLPLCWAVAFGQFDAMIEFLKLGADPHLTQNPTEENPDGQTALQIAQEKEYVAIVEFLEEYLDRLKEIG